MRLGHFLALAALCSGAIYEGKTPEHAGSIVFLGKFVFDVAGLVNPRFNITLHIPAALIHDPAYTQWQLLLYDDEDNSWPMVYGSDLDCVEARTHAKNTGTIVEWDREGQFTYTGVISQRSRPRYWYLTLMNCNEAGIPAGVHYLAHFENADRDPWYRELGYNVMGINSMYVVMFLLFFPFTCLHIYGVFTLRKKLQFVHPLIKVFTLVILIQLFIILCNLSYWGAYWHNGHGLAGAKPIGEIADIVARILFMLVLILLAKGWTISGEELTQRFLILGSVGGFGLLFVLILILKNVVTDEAAPNTPLYIRLFIFLLLTGWFGFAVWFAICIRVSYIKEENPVKKSLYRNLGFVFTPWFFGYPMVYIVSLLAAEYRKDIIVETFSLVISLGGYGILSFMLWPSRAEEFFNISTPDVQKTTVDTYEQL